MAAEATLSEIVRKLQQHVDFIVHFAEVGSDADKRDYEVSYRKINEVGFRCQVDMARGIQELALGLRLLEFRKPYSNV